jgi:ADP-ribose pyrophosphatase YjhB (NUDIX family)
MRKAARAIIIQGDKTLVMHRNKHGSQFYTLVGGQVDDHETMEEGLKREIKEETGMDVVRSRLVFVELHPAPYNEQYIYLCEVADDSNVAIQNTSEEALMNRLGMNTHTLYWVEVSAFSRLPFRTQQLQDAIVKAFSKGFPDQPVNL